MRRALLMGAALLAVLGSIALAQSPGVNNTWPITWSFMGEPSTYKATYSATSAPFAAVASAEQVFSIVGSSTKVIRVRRIRINGYAAAPVAEPLYVNKVSSALPSTGTSALLTGVPYDALSSAATARVESFTANPTAQTLVGEMYIPIVRFFSGNTAVDKHAVEINFGANGSTAILRSASQGITLNLAHVTTSATLVATVEWTEE